MMWSFVAPAKLTRVPDRPTGSVERASSTAWHDDASLHSSHAWHFRLLFNHNTKCHTSASCYDGGCIKEPTTRIDSKSGCAQDMEISFEPSSIPNDAEYRRTKIIKMIGITAKATY
jgi:hypothetical protein